MTAGSLSIRFNLLAISSGSRHIPRKAAEEVSFRLRWFGKCAACYALLSCRYHIYVRLCIAQDKTCAGLHDSCANMASFQIKRIQFWGRERVPIFLQNENGPCPLLAIANVLSLRNQLSEISDAVGEIGLDALISLVASRLVDLNDKGTSQSMLPRHCFEMITTGTYQSTGLSQDAAWGQAPTEQSNVTFSNVRASATGTFGCLTACLPSCI